MSDDKPIEFEDPDALFDILFETDDPSIKDGDYFAIELDEMLHDMEYGASDLPWRVFKRSSICGDIWVADCSNKREMKIIVTALNDAEKERQHALEQKRAKTKIILPD